MRPKETHAELRRPAAWEKAANTDRWTEILFRALTSRIAKRWRFVSFRGANGAEWRGAVDVVAIRKNTSNITHEILKRGDLFEMILIQMKGGRARNPSLAEIDRLKAVKRRYGAKAIVPYKWERGESSEFFVLGRGANWERASCLHIFG